MLKIKNKILDNLSKKDGVYKLKVKDMSVEMVYSDNGKRFNECMINILKSKMNLNKN